MSNKQDKKFIGAFIKELPFKDAFRLTFTPEVLFQAVADSEALGKKYIDMNLKRSKSGKMYLELDTFIPKAQNDDTDVPF